MNINPIKEKFDTQWASQDIEKHIKDCPSTEIFSIFEKYIKKGMKILESGCGSGKWVFYFHRKGYDITGLDWSQQTVDRIKTYDGNIKIIQGDARDTKINDEEYDMILSLGTVEHSVDGPELALKEAYRTLKNDGTLIITVPIVTPVRKLVYTIKKPFQLIKSFMLKRKNGDKFNDLITLLKKQINGLQLMHGINDKGYYFFEYRIPLKTFDRYVRNAGFKVLEIFPAFKTDAVFHDITPFGGKWDYENGRAELSLLARILLKLFPNLFYHMIVCVCQKRMD
ncbi:hypothetical protein A2230_08215 [candidate division WOR-1 bacterium RIFOXYA2_FULL_36_21]|uniref:Methyltransferase type 11 domain-containing protein n=1 Tax=candidate division WOR-1 bacterium RIFOXYB2_FULL_36_35 TaxID=1802578 RepID=A0A1F4S895_UNCSA|nr:MAG: hypothetical protein A2230_08215 [candidate division WOR-1 bacterium RIFOXYA2_FULL_36_21]OGC14625.1 MAG: hypothetical protein A2282_04230 [candidate division WOR-1 bacterium RIFOXYA12_FULL_36_13]OGC16640.1 MAG: hypothetical protein A2290_03430 [candidate division WOR-1 bacterium RIFOXYB2_FULL_36_35]